MTTTLYRDQLRSHDDSDPAILTGVLSISGLPRALRPDVETLMAECLVSEPQLYCPGVDPMECDWFTRWSRDSSSSIPGDYRVRCRQTLTGTLAEFELLTTALRSLTRASGFRVGFRVVE